MGHETASPRWSSLSSAGPSPRSHPLRKGRTTSCPSRRRPKRRPRPRTARRPPRAKPHRGAEDGAAPLVTQAAYDESLNRLGEISGALFHLDALCRPGREEVWRRHVEQFLEAQRLGDERSGRLIASFNTGYRDYAATHAACTPAARELSRRFAREGVAITSDLAARYGN